MHEQALARTIIDRLPDNVPRGCELSTVNVSVGPSQAFQPEVLHSAWEAETRMTAYSGVRLKVRRLPYRRRCNDCGRQWECERHDEHCTCGNQRPERHGDDELRIDSVEIEPRDDMHDGIPHL